MRSRSSPASPVSKKPEPESARRPCRNPRRPPGPSSRPAETAAGFAELSTSPANPQDWAAAPQRLAEISEGPFTVKKASRKSAEPEVSSRRLRGNPRSVSRPILSTCGNPRSFRHQLKSLADFRDAFVDFFFSLRISAKRSGTLSLVLRISARRSRASFRARGFPRRFFHVTHTNITKK